MHSRALQTPRIRIPGETSNRPEYERTLGNGCGEGAVEGENPKPGVASGFREAQGLQRAASLVVVPTASLLETSLPFCPVPLGTFCLRRGPPLLLALLKAAGSKVAPF